MASYSKIIQIGNIVHDLKSKDVNGKTCLTFALATNFKYGDKEDSCFIDVTFWEKSAENIEKYFHKGDPILVEGELRQERWEDRDGGKRSKHVIRGTSWGFLPGAKKEDGGGQAPRNDGYPPPKHGATDVAVRPVSPTNPPAQPPADAGGYGKDEIPF